MEMITKVCGSINEAKTAHLHCIVRASRGGFPGNSLTRLRGSYVIFAVKSWNVYKRAAETRIQKCRNDIHRKFQSEKQNQKV